MNIQNVKLKSGEEIISDLTENETSYNMKNPCILVPSGEHGIAMAPWMPFAKISKDGIDIPKSSVLLVIEIIDEIEAQYEQQFGSGIITPPTKVVELATGSLKLTT
ncbi:TPA: hypothetical protein HA278_07690 [Candidatus Woesearchaeota archaeon]|nr:hypothetical protein [Candidatus Woesearchaeota archaeon]|tara:strand:- start:2494 stop:2811 length:318 start_codon:yes stop_codon:yes gene_type:complete